MKAQKKRKMNLEKINKILENERLKYQKKIGNLTTKASPRNNDYISKEYEFKPAGIYRA